MNFDDVDWFPARIMLDYGDENLADIPHQEYLRKRESRIMMYINANPDDGINHLALARKVNIDRKNLTPYMKRLMKKGLVIRGDGKRGKYYPATKKNRGISVTADIFSGVAAGTILEFDRNFPIDSPYFKSEIIDDKFSFENALFMFSNGIGSIITYLLIQSMNQSYNIHGKGAKSDEEKDINVRRWFSDAMSTLGVILLTLFKQAMATPLIISNNNYIKKDGKPDFYRAGTNLLKEIFSSPSYIHDEKYTASLMTSFSRIYPSVYNQLDKIKDRLPLAEFWETNHRVYEKISYWQQKKCRHTYTLPSNKSLSAEYENNLLHCSRCHKSRYIKNPFRSR